MDKNRCNACGESPQKCSCKNKDFTRNVVEINNPGCVTLMREISVPASMGDDTTYPPVVGKYRNVLVRYEANSKTYLYSSDGIPVQLNNGITDYEDAINLPQINGVTLKGNKSGDDLGLQNKLSVDTSTGLSINGDELSATPATKTNLGVVKIGDGVEVSNDGEISISEIEKYAVLFRTVSEMQSSDILQDGKIAKTMGYYTEQDGLGAYYNIGTSGDIPLSNGLYATPINNIGGNNYYDEITYTKTRRYDTTIYITTIPYQDSNSNEIGITLDEANLKPSKYAQDNYTTLTCNGVAWVDGSHEYGSVIGNSTILADVDTSDIPDCYYYIGFKANRVITDFKANTNTVQTMLNAGCEQAFMAYWRLISNSVTQDFDVIQSQLLDSGVVNTPNPRQAIGQKSDKTVVFVTCDGRTPLDKGLTSAELATIMQELGCVNAWNLDGGGSATTVYKGSKINKSVDSNGTAERTHRYLINVKREIINEELARAYSQSGFAINESYNKLLPIINQAIVAGVDGEDIDDMIEGQSLLLSNHTTNPPISDNSYYVMNVPHPNPLYRGLYGMQVAFGRENNKAFQRRLVNGSFQEWQPMFGYYHTAYTLENYTGTLSATYEPVELDAYHSNMDNGVVPEGNNATFTGFKVLCNADDRFELTLSLGCTAASTGAKYASLYIDGAQIVESTVFQHCAAGDKITMSTTAYLPYSLKNKTLEIKVYGDTGDVWTRPKACFKQIA